MRKCVYDANPLGVAQTLSHSPCMKPKVGRMKTLERSPKRLRMTHFGWYYGAIAAVFGALCLYAGLSLWADGNLRDAFIFTFLGGGAALILGLVATRKFTVTLDKAAGIVHVRNGTVLGTKVRSAPLHALKGAHMQTSYTGDLALHRLVLLFHDREGWVVTKMYTSGDGTTEALTQINTWMHLHLPPIEDTHEDHPQHA
jgi:hypothetical protein